MSAKTEKLAHIIKELATPILLSFAKENGEDFGIVSVTGCEVSSDYSYADISISSTNNEKGLPKFFAPLASEIRRVIGKQVNTRKIPHVRFKIIKGQEEANRVYSILSQLEQTYDLSQTD